MVKTFRNRFLLVGLMTTLGFNFASAGDAPHGRQRLVINWPGYNGRPEAKKPTQGQGS